VFNTPMDSDFEQLHTARRRSALAGLAGVGISLGLTELIAGMSTSVPSAISSIGAFVVDNSPAWLESFAISAFGTADKAVLAISIVVVVLVLGWFVGRVSAANPAPMVIAFSVAGVLGIAAQLTEAGAEVAPVVASTLVSMGAGLATWYSITVWTRPVDRPVTDNDVTDIGRRRLMLALAGAATVSVVMVGVGRSKLRARAEAQRSALVLPPPVESQPDPTSANDFDLPFLTAIVADNNVFYRIDTALVVPAVDPADWTLTIKGMVDQEVVLTYQDIAEMDLVERYVTLSCVSNGVGDRLIGNALWTGVMLSDLLDMAGVQQGADQIVGRSVDGWTAGFPTDVAFDGRDAMLAIGMNREVLPADHGFPARLVVPGLYGYVSATKWITEIELTTWDAFDAYWIPRGWAKEGPIKTQSRVDRPVDRSEIVPGSYTFGGVAWAPTRGIQQVEIQIDEGPWMPADLSEPLSNDSWIQWKADATVAEGDHTVRVRATDGTGATQGETPVSPRPDGAEGWHTIRFTATV
jgi:DMSO/TMAO reductase YedYZ molybdopterin-dependent catalytic subunit